MATTQAICDYRRQQGTSGPLLIGRDTHALSYPAWTDSLEVLSANGVEVLIDSGNGYTPTPAVSHAILRLNGARRGGPGAADGIVITPSHNPPGDGGFKYNPPHGGPADSDATGWIAERANALLDADLSCVERTPLARVLSEAGRYDFLGHYVEDLANVLDIDAIRDVGVRIGADPMGGASVGYWGEIRTSAQDRSYRRQPHGRPAVGVHDPRPRRQDPDGLLLASCDGEPDSAQR